MSGTDDDGLISEIRSPRFRRFFAGYAGRLISRRFHGVRLLRGSRTAPAGRLGTSQALGLPSTESERRLRWVPRRLHEGVAG